MSHDPTGRGTSVADQEREGRKWCADNGHEVGWVVVDNDLSASRHSKKERPGYTAVWTKLAGGDPVDILWAWESSRFQRDLDVYVQVRSLCEQFGVLWSYHGRVYDLSRTDDRFSTAMDALLAERYADETRDRVLRSVRSRMERGLPHGRIPYGYTSLYDPSTGAPAGREREPAQAAVVVEIFQRLLNQEALYGISADLNRRGIQSPRGALLERLGRDEHDEGWTPLQVRRVGLKAVYAGLREHKGEIVGEGTWPAIVDLDTFYAVLSMLRNPSRKSWHDGATKHLLAGILLCGVCGSPCRRVKNRNTPSYMCHDKFCVATAQAPIDGHLQFLVVDRVGHPEFREAFERHDGDQGRAEARREVTRLEGRLEAFYTSAEEPDGISPETLARMEAKYRPLIADAKIRAAPPAESSELADMASTSDPAGVWDRFTVVQRRKLVRALMVVELLPVGQGKRVFDPSRLRITYRI